MHATDQFTLVRHIDPTSVPVGAHVRSAVVEGAPVIERVVAPAPSTDDEGYTHVWLRFDPLALAHEVVIPPGQTMAVLVRFVEVPAEHLAPQMLVTNVGPIETVEVDQEAGDVDVALAHGAGFSLRFGETVVVETTLLPFS